MDRTVSYHFEDAQPNGQPPVAWDGVAGGSSAGAIDNDGHIFGTAFGGYEGRDFVTDAESNIIHPRIWGFWSGGWDFTSGGALGTIAFALSGDTYTFNGHDRAIQKVRNQTTFGYQTGDANGGYYHNPYTGPGYTFTSASPGFTFVNDQAVDFTPISVNSSHKVLSKGNFSPQFNWFIDDTTNNTFTDLEVPPPIYLGPFPIAQLYSLAALNERQILAYDANGQPILDSNGQQTTKASAQIIGGDYTLWDSSAMIWEENPVTHHYQSEYLSRLIAPGSGWEIVDAYDINDEGVIAADGWYQPSDQNGQPIGPKQWRSCLLWPMKTAYVFLGASAVSKGDQGNPNVVSNNLVNYLDGVAYNADPSVIQFLTTFDGPHGGAVVKFAKDARFDSELVRVFIYNSVQATRMDGDIAKQAMKEALSTPGAYVLFNGHSNTGTGPAFSLDVGGLSGLMHVANPTSAVSLDLMTDEGYNFALRGYVPGDPQNEILESGTNYSVPILGIPRFPSSPPQNVFEVIGFGSAAYHYWSDIKDQMGDQPDLMPFTLVHTSSADLPPLRYTWFFFDGCNSGRDYIEVFQHGLFFYSRNLTGVPSTTSDFVQGIVEGRRPAAITFNLNQPYEDKQTYKFHQFVP